VAVIDPAKEGIVARWGGVWTRSFAQLSADGKRLYVSSQGVTPGTLEALVLPGKPDDKPAVRRANVPQSNKLGGEFLATPDGRFLLCRTGTVLRSSSDPAEDLKFHAAVEPFAAAAVDPRPVLVRALAIVGIVAAVLVAAVLCAILGVAIELIAYRPLRNAPRLAPLITAIGVSLALETGALIIWGATFQVFPSILPSTVWDLSGVVISSTQVVIFVLTIALMAVLYLFVQRTMLGKAMRAIAIDQDTARLMGINVDSVISLTFFIGSMLGAAAGIMAGIYYTSIDFNMGFIIGLKAFTAAVIGGIGNIPGAMLGGYVLGLLEALGVGSGIISSSWRDVFVFAILILVLVFRPTGILGEHVVEKV